MEGVTGLIHVILFEPEIPPNTGNIIRLCANTGFGLHLIGPLGFKLSDARLRRAGLDYHEWVRVREYHSLAACLEALGGPRLVAISTRGTRVYSDFGFRAGDALLFGSELRGLPGDLLMALPPPLVLRIPMRPASRSLNLSNAAAVVAYEAWRQLGFPGRVAEPDGLPGATGPG
jgi:tRNA (cytidine/uridine-2'-O-)-methyltransferase